MVTDLFSSPYEATENHQFHLEDSDLQKLLLLLYGCDSSTTNTDLFFMYLDSNGVCWCNGESVSR